MGHACGIKKNKVSGCHNNGTCGTGGCNKMNVFDWLSNMQVPVEEKFDIVEVRFKNGRKDFYRNKEKIALTTGDAVIVEAQHGHHIGYVSLQGELVRLQMQKKKIANNKEIKKILRIAQLGDLEKFEQIKKREESTLYRCREIINQFNLSMKLSDVEYQADNSRATFFYSADGRVDFRNLIKQLIAEFRVRIEMKQISLRQEAGQLGGIGICGRELCCSTWLSTFKNVSTSAARYQNLSLNPTKLSGQCGRLKCCLNFELETYMDALQHIPEVVNPLLTEQGEARLQKTDIFRKIMWFGYKEDNDWYPLNVERVNEIILLNKAGKRPATLQVDKEKLRLPLSVLNSDLESMDKRFKNKAGNRNKKNSPTSSHSPQNKSVNQSNPSPANQQSMGNKKHNHPSRGKAKFKANRNNPSQNRNDSTNNSSSNKV